MRRSLLATRVENLAFPAPPILAEPEGRPSDTPIRLNLNESPYSPSPRAIAAMQSAIRSVNFYPDHGCTALVNALSEKTGIPTAQFSFGNGSGELLIAAGMLVIEEGDEAVFPAPTFPTCGKGVELSGGKVVSVPVTKDGICDVDAMLGVITERTRLFYLCTPNNPTGGILSQADLDKAIVQVPGNCLLVIDEAYFEFAQYEGAPDVLKSLSNRQGPWIVTRTFSKAYALSGLRIGYAISSEKPINDGIWKLRANFNTNRIALAAATAALGDKEHLENILSNTIAQRE
ncbi:pyridoxal phosphate-dependent aminotransferase [Kiloniella antarctica]|uniref:histidinol-phosphate transaminase n=1 Tax=Kiloniella antarctica TaxID=1550907 RepID=A0ABW5BPB9_9PROT